MANIIFLKVRPWEGPRPVECSLSLQKGDFAIVETEDGIESAIVEEIRSGSDGAKLPPGAESGSAGVKIVRKASLRDANMIQDYRKKEAEALRICREETKKREMPMKIIGASYAFDGGSITFAFIADGRIDFRELVKSLSKNFQRSIRLHQIGARDEARGCGGFGICGRELCCKRFKENLPSISSEMAKTQHIVRRGSERISGLCGRLMCCLSYEADQYREMLEELPRVGDEIETKEGKAVVKEVNALTGVAKAELENKNIIRINKS